MPEGGVWGSSLHHLSFILRCGATGTFYISEQKFVRGFHLGNGLAVLRRVSHATMGPSQPHHACMEPQSQLKRGAEASFMLGHPEILSCPLPHEG